jgi:hypothetical protein
MVYRVFHVTVCISYCHLDHEDGLGFIIYGAFSTYRQTVRIVKVALYLRF